MTKIHHAGPNTADLARRAEGHPVLISYADVVRRPGVWKDHILPRLRSGAYSSVIMDSGAFTEKKDPTFHVDVEAYADFVLEHQGLFDIVVNLDDIDGDLERSERNQAYLEGRGIQALPVFHQGEPWEQLESLVERYDHIGVGFARDEKGMTHNCRPFLEEFFTRLAGRARVHGFGMNSWALKGYPFDTTDATTWIAEYCATGRTVNGGALEHFVADLPGDVRAKIVLDSYLVTPPADQDEQSVAFVENGSAGQARVVFRRYGGRALIAKIKEVLAEAA